MSEVPFYLNPNPTPFHQIPIFGASGDLVTSIPLYPDPVLGTAQVSNSDSQLENVWRTVSESVGDFSGGVVDGVKRSWDTILDAGSSIGEGFKDQVTGLWDWAKSQILMVLVIGLVVVWVVAKSGILKQLR